MRKLPETISEDELRQLVKAVTNRNLKHHKAAFILGFYQCMRVSEVVALRQEDIDSTRGFIHIKQGKGSKDRDIPIMPESRPYLRHVPINCSMRALQYAFKRKAQKVLKKDLHFHTLRHSGATHYLNTKRVDIRYIQALLGHSRLDTTQIYTHVTPENLKQGFHIPENAKHE